MRWQLILIGLVLVVAVNSKALNIIEVPKASDESSVESVLAAKDWYESALFYQIYPRSFKDSDGDGVGDLQGIIANLEHLKDIGVDATWLSPVFKSPMKDFGYDVSDFYNIDEIFGTNEDMEELFARAKELGIKIILDFVPNHSSNEHQWFIDSENRDNGKDDWYVWRDANGEDADGNPIVPCNWQSVFYGPAWTWSETRQQFYLHQFDASQPDLNYRNPEVMAEMKNVIKFWLDKGAAGFRVDAINHMFETEEPIDEPLSGNTDDPNSYGYTDHIYTKDMQETYDAIYEIREFMDQYTQENGGDTRIMMTEAYASFELTAKYYGENGKKGSHMPFNFMLLWDSIPNYTALQLKTEIDNWLSHVPAGYSTNWVLGNHDQWRLGSRYGEDRIDGMLALEMSLPGLAVTYNGEEIGMVNNMDISWEDTQDPQACNGPEESYLSNSRDPERTPFQWDASEYAGFSTFKPWLPVHENYVTLNLAAQKEDDSSIYNFYKSLTHLRKLPVMTEGSYTSKAVSDNVLLVKRSLGGTNLIFIINMGELIEAFNLNYYFDGLGAAVLKIRSTKSYKPYGEVDLESIRVEPYEVMVLEVINGAKTNKDWYESALFYQIYPRSFKDSDGDGVGDLQGIIANLDHLKDIGVDATWLSPVFKSPMKDFGYDVSDFYNIDEIFGTNEDMEELFARAKELGIKIILDFVPNHSSNEHQWFIDSENRDNGKDDWYVWRDANGEDADGNPIVPCNWQSVFYGPAWTWSEKRQQFYLHQFDASQPDLNFRNPEVMEAMKDIIKFWLDKGAAGFRVDAINHLFETEEPIDEPLTGWTDDPNSYGYTHHIYTKDMQETYEAIYEIREFMDQYTQENGGDTRILLTEAYASYELLHKYYGENGKKGSHMPFNFMLIADDGHEWGALRFKSEIERWMHFVPYGLSTNWVVGNHDKWRLGSRYGEDRIDGMLALEMALPGLAVTYYGEELGMVNNMDISWEDTQDPQACNGPEENYMSASRDPVRTPFQWDATENAGFSSFKPWLPVHENYLTLNLEAQKDDDNSMYNYYKSLTSLRKESVLTDGSIIVRAPLDNVLIIKRTLADFSYIFLINIGGNKETIDVSHQFENIGTARIKIRSTKSTKAYEDVANLDQFELEAYEAIVLEVEAEEKSEKDWYETASFYQIYPRSFKDSDGDGIGDLQGIIDNLDHLKDLGVTATWLSPIFKSPMNDFGYDVSDFYNVDPIFGTNEDLKALFAKAKELDIKIILDFVPNHSSNEHQWFIDSENRENDKDDWYIWRDPKGYNSEGEPIPPSNWVSVFYGSAWTWSEKRQQFYLHQFDPSQPDLNFRHPEVVLAMKDVFKYWLEEGASGFRIDAINHLFEVETPIDEPLLNENDDPLSHFSYDHKYTMNMDETYDMIFQFRELLDEFQVENGGETRIMMTEAYTSHENVMKYYQSEDKGRQGSHLPFNFVTINDLDKDSTPEDFKTLIDDWISQIPEGKATNWVLGNHDRARVGTRYGEERIEGLLVLEMGLPGVAVTYYGEEIGMVNNMDISWEDTQDPQACNGLEENYEEFSRDPVRTPFQWDDTDYAGFSTGKTWLPVHENYKTLNLAAQKTADKSIYKLYKSLMELRESDILKEGTYESSVLGEDVFAYKRYYHEEHDDDDDHHHEEDFIDTYVYIINFGDSERTVDVQEMIGDDQARVVIASSSTGFNPGDQFIGSFKLPKYGAVVLQKGAASTIIVSSLLLLMAVVKALFW